MKSQSELNWIFIIIAGAIILAFFTGFALKYKDLQEEKLSIESLTSLDNTFTSFKTSPFKTLDSINLPLELEIGCNELKINDKTYSVNNLLFSPNKLKNKIFIYYIPFKAPFKISDLYLITDNRITTINTNDQGYLINLINRLPQELQGKFSISTQGTKNIQINTQINTFTLNNKQYPLHESLVYGAMFSDNFDCVYDKVKQEINNAVNIYRDKALLLRKENCNYNVLIPYFLSNPEQQLNMQNINAIETINQELAARSCPVLY